jgi:hypothetical protein
MGAYLRAHLKVNGRALQRKTARSRATDCDGNALEMLSFQSLQCVDWGGTQLQGVAEDR